MNSFRLNLDYKRRYKTFAKQTAIAAWRRCKPQIWTSLIHYDICLKKECKISFKKTFFSILSNQVFRTYHVRRSDHYRIDIPCIVIVSQVLYITSYCQPMDFRQFIEFSMPNEIFAIVSFTEIEWMIEWTDCWFFHLMILYDTRNWYFDNICS